ncbi:XRE family transcriptional regulator [Streptomyces sp. NPDC002990]
MSQIPGNPAFRTARLERGWHSQADVAEAYARHAAALGEPTSIDVRQVRRWESARPGWPTRSARRVLRTMFGVPLQELGFTPHRGQAQSAIEEGEAAVRRRSFLHGVLAGATPVVSTAGRGQLTAALADAGRYNDRALVDHLRTALDEAARADGSTGPRNALPKATDILCVIDALAHNASEAVRKDLLAIGARAAEFTAFLHRDAGAPPHVALYFYDRAAEWATLTGDGPMQAYVLLRKAQATDRRDAARMLDLTRAAAHGPWKLPPRARAEALQQHARALAVTGARPDTVAQSLDQAHDALGEAGPAEPSTCTGPLCAGYNTDRLMAQSAISYRKPASPPKPWTCCASTWPVGSSHPETVRSSAHTWPALWPQQANPTRPPQPA